MKNKIIDYIGRQSLDFCEYNPNENKIYIDYSYNPVSAVILNDLILRHFNVTRRYCFLGSMLAIYID